MNNSIMTPVSEVKSVTGNYFKLITCNEYNEKPNFLDVLNRVHFRSFPQKIELFYNLFTGKTKSSSNAIKMREKLYAAYADWFAEDSNYIFKTKEELLNYITEEILSSFKFFMEKSQNTFFSKVSDKDNLTKKIFMNSTPVKQLDFLKNNAENINQQSVEDWLKIEVVPAVSQYVKEMKVPSNWREAFNNHVTQNLYIIHDDEIKIMKNCNLLHVSYDDKDNSLCFNYELNTNTTTRVSMQKAHYHYSEETKNYTFDKPIYFTKEEAEAAYLKIITEQEAKLNKMKSLIAA